MLPRLPFSSSSPAKAGALALMMGIPPYAPFSSAFFMIKPRDEVLSPLDISAPAADTIRRGDAAMMTAFIRTIILYFLIMTGLRLLGKRQIGELEPSELVLTMMLSDLATVPMQDFGIPLLSGVVPILTLLALSVLLSQLSLHSLRFRALACGRPTLLIRKGVVQQDAMRRNRFTLDELLEELRGQGYTSVDSVKYAVLENSGQLSVLPWTREQPPTAAQMGLALEDEVTLPIILINDGRVLRQNLLACGRDEAWLRKQLKQRDIARPGDVFLFTLDEKNTVLCVKKEAV